MYMTTTEEIIERDRIRKQKSVEAQRRYRKKVKEGTPNIYIHRRSNSWKRSMRFRVEG
jgi:hypothetical protein